jgi:hypothetical protein
MLRRAPLERNDISEERSASVIKVTRIGELGIKLAASNNRRVFSNILERQEQVKVRFTGNDGKCQFC